MCNPSCKLGSCTLGPVSVEIAPEPPDSEREAILAALADLGGEPPCGWARAALSEGVETDEPDP